MTDGIDWKANCERVQAHLQHCIQERDALKVDVDGWFKAAGEHENAWLDCQKQLYEMTQERNALREKAHDLDVKRAQAEWQAQGLEIERDALRLQAQEVPRLQARVAQLTRQRDEAELRVAELEQQIRPGMGDPIPVVEDWLMKSTERDEQCGGRACPECQKAGRTSRVFELVREGTCLGWRPHFDEKGIRHSHDPNTYVIHYECSDGHQWSQHSKIPCPACDYPP